jgi:leader peptidase (prepilin peptidase)/N-methyltransferase
MVDWAVVLPMFWMLITLVPIAAIDFPYQLLPDTVSIGGLLLGFAVCLLPGGIGWLQCVLGVAIAGGGLFVFAWIMGKILKRDAMGFGDIKLLAAFGSMMGPSRAVAALIAAAFLALVVMIPWRTLRRESNSEPLAIGPFIGVMGPVMFLWGDRLIAGYFSLFAQNS